MSLIEGRPHLKRNDSRPGVIVSTDKAAHAARMKVLHHRQTQADIIQKQADDIAKLQRMVYRLMGVEESQIGKN